MSCPASHFIGRHLVFAGDDTHWEYLSVKYDFRISGSVSQSVSVSENDNVLNSTFPFIANFEYVKSFRVQIF